MVVGGSGVDVQFTVADDAVIALLDDAVRKSGPAGAGHR
jgi:hypothetical protein